MSLSIPLVHPKPNNYHTGVSVTPLFGGYLADTYLGRFKTVCWSVFISMIGYIILTISAVPGVIHDPNNSFMVFIIAITIIGFVSSFLEIFALLYSFNFLIVLSIGTQSLFRGFNPLTR